MHDACNMLITQAAEKKLQELKASLKQSQNAESQVAGLQKELEEAQAALQASQDAIKASDSEKVSHFDHRLLSLIALWQPSLHTCF